MCVGKTNGLTVIGSAGLGAGEDGLLELLQASTQGSSLYIYNYWHLVLLLLMPLKIKILFSLHKIPFSVCSFYVVTFYF